MMTRSGGQLAVAHRTQFPAQCLLGDADPEFLPDPLAQVDQPPAHNAINRRGRAAFDRRPQRRAVCLVQLRRLAGRLAGDQPVRTMGVELDHPSSNDLQCHPADRRRLGPPRPVIDSGQGQKTARLRRILCTPCNGAQARRIKIGPQRDRHGEPPSFATLESDSRRSGNPPATRSQRLGINPFSWVPSPRVRGERQGEGQSACHRGHPVGGDLAVFDDERDAGGIAQHRRQL